MNHTYTSKLTWVTKSLKDFNFNQLEENTP
jgi:hypothetical protein